MNQYKTGCKDTKDQELFITRTFDASRESVWRAWKDPNIMKRWWGPKGFTSPYCMIDLRVDGKFLYCMRSPEGKDYWNTGVYQEIIPQARIVFSNSFADEKGNVVQATKYGMSADFPLEMLVTVTFEEIREKTKLTISHVGIPAGADHDGANIGWNQSLDKLAEALR
ncbi:MAG TPA: SRPBCC domain-containing protein [Nitrososphaeraceae archaeon]|jgi:uncharacterized protein YndB with AHSA1/START domain